MGFRVQLRALRLLTGGWTLEGLWVAGLPCAYLNPYALSKNSEFCGLDAGLLPILFLRAP